MVITYHYIRNAERALSVERFKRQLDYISDYAILTFDDGFKDHYETVFPILKERNLKGIFFPCRYEGQEILNVHKIHLLLWEFGDKIYEDIGHEIKRRTGLYKYDTDKIAKIKQLLNYELPFEEATEIIDKLFNKLNPPEIYMTQDQIKEMSDYGMIFGGHTKTHRVLSRLTPEEQHKECDLTLIKQITNQSDIPFCYPYGHHHTYTKETIDILKDLGYSRAYTVGKTYNGQFEIPRLDTNEV